MRILVASFLVILVGSSWWYLQRRSLTRDRVRTTETALPSDLDRWLEAGLLSRPEVDAIVAFERARSPQRKIPLFTEALGYVGAALALAGGGVAIGQGWDDLSDFAHVAILFTVTGAALAGGWLIRRQIDPAMRRMKSVLWALSVAGFAAALAVSFVDVVELPEDGLALAIGGCTALYAGLLWSFNRTVLQQVALFAPGLAAALGAANVVPGEAEIWVYGLVTWTFAALWMALGWVDRMSPGWSAVGLGSVVIAYAGTIGAYDHGWLLGVGLVTGAALMTLSITSRKLPLLGVGGIATFGYLTALVVRYFGDTLGIPMALGIVGILILGIAVIVGRSGALGGPGWRHPAAPQAG